MGEVFREVMLECVTEVNNNKFYHMKQTSEEWFDVVYGRIGADIGNVARYPMKKWDQKYREKIKKGYQDMTALRLDQVKAPEQKESYLPIQDASIASLVEYLQKKARQTIRDNYTISSKVVTQKMVDEAQRVIDALVSTPTRELFNERLLQLFHILPRKMYQVSDFLLGRDTPEERQRIIRNEQALLDVMASQVAAPVPVAVSNVSQDMTILDAYGLTIEPVTEKDVALIKKQLGECANLYYSAWKVTNKKTEEAFQKFVKEKKMLKRKRKLFWHGSRTENWWGILRTGLRLRPTNVVTNGKMFGIGTYFAPKARKSVGYTSLKNSYWANGTSEFGFLALFETAYGTPWFPSRYPDNASAYNYEALQRMMPGADCLHAKAGLPCHNFNLRNDEIIFYREDQMTIRYLVELRA